MKLSPSLLRVGMKQLSDPDRLLQTAEPFYIYLKLLSLACAQHWMVIGAIALRRGVF
jgi:hypothetical protein